MITAETAGHLRTTNAHNAASKEEIGRICLSTVHALAKNRFMKAFKVVRCLLSIFLVK